LIKLKAYLKDKNLSAQDFASLCKLSFPVIYRVLDEKNISARNAKKIYKKTRGSVTYKNIHNPKDIA